MGGEAGSSATSIRSPSSTGPRRPGTGVASRRFREKPAFPAKAHHDGERVAPLAAMRPAGLHAGQQGADGVVHRCFLDAVELQLVRQQADAETRSRIADGVVEVHEVGHAGEQPRARSRRRRGGFRRRGRRSRPAAWPARAGRAAPRRRRAARPRAGQGAQALAEVEGDVVAGAVAVVAVVELDVEVAAPGSCRAKEWRTSPLKLKGAAVPALVWRRRTSGTARMSRRRRSCRRSVSSSWRRRAGRGRAEARSCCRRAAASPSRRG
jgi:hypothetical protein